MRQALLSTAALLRASCASDTLVVETSEDGAPAPLPAPEEGVTLTTFDCGTVLVGDLSLFADDGSYDGQSDTYANTCFVVRHPDGRSLLWDTGLPSALVENGPMTEGPFTVAMDVRLADSLAAAGVSPTFVSISHNHFDHTGQPEAAAGATWIVHEDELTFMKANPEADRGGAWGGFMALDTVTFTGGYDVFGDGSARILDTPGHTPGHTSLVVNLRESGPVLLTGDLYHREESREGRKVPSFNADAEETRASMARFEDLAEGLGARVIIQHEPDDVGGLIGDTLR